MNFSTYAYTNAGDRKNNEDNYLCCNNFWMVADGLGGHENGEVASLAATDALEALIREHGLGIETADIDYMIKTANSAVIRAQQIEGNDAKMRTTIVLAVSDGTKLRYANVGDSRFYYFKSGRICHQSEDHSVSATSAKMGDIRYQDIREDADKNKLIKVLGNAEELNVKIPQTLITVEPGDAFLLCSDGLWEHVYELEMEADLAKSFTPQQWVEFMAKRVILKTGMKDNDNFTAVAVMVN